MKRYYVIFLFSHYGCFGSHVTWGSFENKEEYDKLCERVKLAHGTAETLKDNVSPEEIKDMFSLLDERFDTEERVQKVLWKEYLLSGQ